MTKKKKNNHIINTEPEIGIKVDFLNKEVNESYETEIRATSQAVINGTNGFYSLTFPVSEIGIFEGYEVENYAERRMQGEKVARALFEVIIRAHPEAFETRNGFTECPEGASREEKVKHFQNPVVYDWKALELRPDFRFVACQIKSPTDEECLHGYGSYLYTPVWEHQGE